MNQFAFVSKYPPTKKHIELAESANIELVHVKQTSSFAIEPFSFVGYEGVVVAHPAAALRLISGTIVGVFENNNGQPVKLHLFSIESQMKHYQ